MNGYERVRIENIMVHGDTTRTFVFDHDFEPKPGQFGMVFMSGVDEKPFSFSMKNAMTVKKRGPFTEKLFEFEEGDHLLVRGPYGKGIFPQGRYAVFGGGCGAAPLYLMTQSEGYDIRLAVVAGATKGSIPFIDEWPNAVVFTEDGSAGRKGVITDFDFGSLPDTSYAVCGPEPMMAKVARMIGRPHETHLSLERRMKCGRGGCGECSISGYSVCVDGPVFRYAQVLDMPHFNRCGRAQNGELKPIGQF